MYIKVDEFKALERFYMLHTIGNDYYEKRLVPDGVTWADVETDAWQTLSALHERYIKSKDATAKRMKYYRATDPKYKRTKDAILRRERAKARLLKKLQQKED